MSKVFDEPTCVDAWLRVASHLLTTSVEPNVLVTINNPGYLDPAWLTRFNPREVIAGGDQIRDVSNTLFPSKTWQNSVNRPTFYKRYKRAHQRGTRKGWGTYFGRLISFGESEENQLENVIRALKTWKNNPHAALTLHLASPETDSLRPLGAPCWHYGEFVCPDKTMVDLVAVYRNHDYFNKALGNFVGLSRLLSFVCDQTGRAPGRLVCHSVRAYFDSSKTQLKALMAR